MTEKSIILTAQEVQAILDGRKTMFRVPVKDSMVQSIPWNELNRSMNTPPHQHDNGKFYIELQSAVDDTRHLEIKPPWQPGDVLWVKETWRDRWGMAYANFGTGNAYPIDDVREIEYRAGGNGFFMNGCNLCLDEPTVKWLEWSKWRSSNQMPRAAARIFLKVTNVRAERLQEITEEDAMDEGVKDPYDYQHPDYYEQPHMRGLEINKSAFAGLWDSLNAKRGYGWDVNPWVWVVEFERTEVTKNG